MKSDPLPTELNQLRYKRDHIHQMMNYPPTKDLELSYDDICIISRYLSKDRMFNKSFDMYLKQILSVSNEPAVQIRTKEKFYNQFHSNATQKRFMETYFELGPDFKMLDRKCFG